MPKRKLSGFELFEQNAKIPRLTFDPKKAQQTPHFYQLSAIQDLRAIFAGPGSNTRAYLYIATGGGKTLVANNYIHDELLTKGKKVLWISHGAHLLYQAAKDLVARFGDQFGDVRSTLFYFGSQNEDWELKRYLNQFPGTSSNSTPTVLYSTWQTVYRALQDKRDPSYKRLASFCPDLVVIDEAHWGKSGELERAVYGELFDGKWSNQNVLGLSATPKIRQRLGWRKTHAGNAAFHSLVNLGILARPVPIKLKLPSDVKIKLDSTNRITNYSEIGRDRKRNLEIVRHFQENRAKYGKTLFFACDVEHAELLGELLRGEAVVVIHAGKSKPHQAIEGFKESEFDVAIVVQMAKEGIDIPDLKTVVLCKPVTSQVEFAQMIGRASRVTATKKTFYIVDCYDTLSDPRIEAQLYHFQDYFSGANDREEASHEESSSKILPAKAPVLFGDYKQEHSHDSRAGLENLNYDPSRTPTLDPSFQFLHGLRIHPKQTFGLELELASVNGQTNPDVEASWRSKAEDLHRYLQGVVGKANVKKLEYSKDADYTKWNVVYDSTCGWEIVSPILEGKNGFEEVLTLLRRIEEDELLSRLKLETNSATGLHVHLGWEYKDPEKVRRTIQFLRMIEPALYSLVAPSRVIGIGGEYCESIRKHFSDKKLRELVDADALFKYFGHKHDRYRVINLTKYDSKNSTAEIRLHNGSFSPGKVTLWVALWMNILNSVENFDIPEVNAFTCPATLELPNKDPYSDIVEVAYRFLGLQHESHRTMLERLHQRRKDVISSQHWQSALMSKGVSNVELIRHWERQFSLLMNREIALKKIA